MALQRKVGIVTDTTCSIPKELADHYEILQVPISIQFGQDSYREGEDITAEEFYEKLGRGDVPTTSQPAPGDFIAAYQRLVGKVQSIISIHVTGKSSGTVQAAALAGETLPDEDITVVDSGFTSMALGFMVLEAARRARCGCGKEEVLCAIEVTRDRIVPFMAVPTLEFLRKSGRVGTGMAVLGSLLAIKPILSMKDGLVTAVDRVRTYPKALNRLSELAETAARGHKVRLAVVYARVQDEARRYCQQVQRRLSVVDEPIVSEIGAALAVHGGPGMLGIIIQKVDD